MYEKFYGFKRLPFQLLPNPDFFYRSQQHENALTHLEYGVFERAGFIVITGELGTGKTTLLRYLLRSFDKNLPIAKDQITIGGYRLAYVINFIFSSTELQVPNEMGFEVGGLTDISEIFTQ